MTEQIKVPALRGAGAKTMTLARLHLSVDVYPALSFIELAQTYTNDDEVDIEATYTFPLPSNAVLLGLEVIVAGKSLCGTVVEKAEAQERYEKAIAKGDSAFHVEQVGDGLYVANIGNLRAGETAKITLRYALLQRWENDLLRLAFPATVAPRYGDNETLGLTEHRALSIDPLAEQPYSFELRVHGDLAGAEIWSATHELTLKRETAIAHVSFARGQVPADRDLVVLLRSPTKSTEGFVLYAPDGDGTVGLASFHLPSANGKRAPRSVKLILDCSGSMAGDSIEQAKAAMHQALQDLREGDFFALTAFGNTHVHFAKRMMPATRENIAAARRWLQARNADMGGTEMALALEAALAVRGPLGNDLLLVTDGEVSELGEVATIAKASGQRIFVIGVGASPAEGVIQALADQSGGSATFVTPHEDITKAVFVQFLRMAQPRLDGWAMHWPSEPIWQAQASPGACFGGDTVVVAARFAGAVGGAATFKAENCSLTVTPVLNQSELVLRDVPRVAAALRMRALASGSRTQVKELVALALSYQLMSRYTDYIVVHERTAEDKAGALPELRKVSNMLAAGWGGTGSVSSGRMMQVRSSYSASVDLGISAHRSPSELLDIPAFLRGLNEPTAVPPPAITPRLLIKYLNETFAAGKHEHLQIHGLHDITSAAWDLPGELTQMLMNLVAQGWSEHEVVLAFYAALLGSAVGKAFSQRHRRAILRAITLQAPSPELVDWLLEGLTFIKNDNWRWQEPSDRHLPQAAGAS